LVDRRRAERDKVLRVREHPLRHEHAAAAEEKSEPHEEDEASDNNP
jgi:hypothetical protein